MKFVTFFLNHCMYMGNFAGSSFFAHPVDQRTLRQLILRMSTFLHTLANTEQMVLITFKDLLENGHLRGIFPKHPNFFSVKKWRVEPYRKFCLARSCTFC